MSNNTQGTAMVLSPEERLSRLPGAYRKAQEINARLAFAAEHGHLVAPNTAVGALPEGCGVALSLVHVDVVNETYDVGLGKRGLAKSALDRIAAAAGISWDARQSGRIDDASDPHYCHWRAVGRMRQLDGAELQLVGSKEMDLRDGSAQIAALYARYEAKKARGNGRAKDPSDQIREMRLHIMAHAESKARLRAIRSLGIRSAYAADELVRPFVVARIMWTGQSDDPELRRAFALKQADAMIGGSRALFGEAPSLPAPMAAPPLLRPPAIGGDIHAHVPVTHEAQAEPMPGPAAAATPPTGTPSAQSAQPPPSEPAAKPAAGDAPAIRFGQSKGVPLTEADDDELSWYAGALAQSVADPAKARYKASNERDLAAVRAEMARRAAEDAGDGVDGVEDRGDRPEDY